MKNSMQAAVVGDGGRVGFVDRPVPMPGPDEVLVRVHAAALNRADLLMLGGAMHGAQGGAGAPLGMEFAGTVLALGNAVTDLAAGDRVMGSGVGAFAGYAIADRGRVVPLPRADLDFATAATLPVALQTMHDAIVTNGALRAGEAVLVQGASSGVGLMALQIARHLGAGVVIGSSTDAARRARLAEFGADLAIDSNDPRWVERVREATDGLGVDLVVDQLSGPAMAANLQAAAIRGRIVNVGRLAGAHGTFDFDLHAKNRLRYIGVTFRTRTVEEVREVVRRMREDLGDALARGAFALPIAARFPFAALDDAFALMAANRHFGKIVVTMDGPD